MTVTEQKDSSPPVRARRSARAAQRLRLEDEFDAYTQVYRDKALWRRIAFVLAALVFALGVVNTAMVLKAPYVVARPYALGEKPLLVKGARDVPVSGRDLENFFYYTLTLRYAWASATVRYDWIELNDLSVREFQAFLNAFAAKPIPHPNPEITEELPRFKAFMASKTQNNLELSRDNITCIENEPVNGVPQYYCHGRGALLSQSIDPKLEVRPWTRKELHFVGRFQPAVMGHAEPYLWPFSVTYLEATEVPTS